MFRKMLRFKQQIPEAECIKILKEEPRGVLSVLGDDDYPYGMPINHFYCEEDGKLKSNYLAYVYKDFCTAELERVLAGRFPCDKYVIGQSDQYLNTQLVYPVKNMNAKEFIENYMDYDTALYLYVDGKENIPSEQEVEQYLMDLAADEPHAYDLLITYCDSSTLDGKAADVYTVQYMIDMSDEKTIKQFYVTYSDPAKDSYLYINN